MIRLRILCSLLLLALIGSGAARTQALARDGGLPGRCGTEVARAGRSAFASRRDAEATAYAGLATRTRRRFRAEQDGLCGQFVDRFGAACAASADTAPEVVSAPRREVQAIAVGDRVDHFDRGGPRSWNGGWVLLPVGCGLARLHLSQLAAGAEHRPKPRVVAFGLEGPRLIPLILFD